MIYFLQPTDGGPVKIGTTENLSARVKTLEAHYGRPLTVLATMSGGRTEEHAIHKRFSKLRFGQSEQFRPGAELMEFIANPETVEAMESERVAIIHLKGSAPYAAWLEAAHRKTHIAKTSIVRLALAEWAERNGIPTPPEL